MKTNAEKKRNCTLSPLIIKRSQWSIPRSIRFDRESEQYESRWSKGQPKSRDPSSGFGNGTGSRVTFSSRFFTISLSLSLSSYRETRCSTTTIPASNLHRSFIQRGGTQGGGKGERCSIFRSNDVEKRWMKAPREIFRRVVFRFQFSKRWWTRLPIVAPSVANRGTTLDFFLSFSFLFHESRVKRNDSRGQSSII